MNDFIHSNDIKTKMPLRYIFYEEAHRVLKNEGILSIAPFDCEYMCDRDGKKRKYSHEQIIKEIESYGFTFLIKINGAIHFEKYHSAYQWKKHNNDLQFEDMELGPVLNFVKNKK